jgi:hypothetical protein
MHDHDQAPAQAAPAGARTAGRAAEPPAAALQRAAGNRAMGRMLQRMETADAVESLEKSMSAGVMGAERAVLDTLTAFSADPAGFEQVASEYEKKTEAPLAQAVEALAGPDGERAKAISPPGL